MYNFEKPSLLRLSRRRTTDMPRVAVLLATYNGERWLSEQFKSLADQKAVELSVYVSDDSSEDNTAQVLRELAASACVHLLPPAKQRMGSANRNFMRLIAEVEASDAEYVAFCDQDDIWQPLKLSHAIHKLVDTNSDAYSSDIIAFWPDGRRKYIVKSQPQREYDYLFESGGPGCTFVLKAAAYDKLREFVLHNFESVNQAAVHDWLIYAFGRSNGWTWHIDASSLMFYRQHSANAIGVNNGVAAFFQRWQSIRSGKYRRDVLKIASIIGVDNWVTTSLRRFAWSDRLKLLAFAPTFRRAPAEQVALALFLIVIAK